MANKNQRFDSHKVYGTVIHYTSPRDSASQLNLNY